MRTVYLVGSVPLSDTEAVFATISQKLGRYLRWLPDGETGKRLNWVFWLEPIFARHPALEPSGREFRIHPGAMPSTRYRLKPGKTAKDIRLDNILYADQAIDSYARFEKLQKAGVIPAHVKFQVDLVPAHSVLWLFIEDELQGDLDPIFNAAVKREIDRIVAAIPPDRLAIQFDVASAVFARLQRAEPSAYGATKEEMQATFTRILVDLANHVPRSVDLLFHFCYGDNNHKHVVEPTDMGDMVDFANRLTREVGRPIAMVHLPVPRDRSDAAYFEPLRRLKLGPETLLCLGLVHHTDGIEGTRKRLATADRFAQGFAIATECGFGRRRPETLMELLDIHAAAAES